MGKKKKDDKIEEDIYQINYQLDQLNARLMVLSTRLRDLSRYTEYIAGNVDFSISYTEHLADLFSTNSNSSLRVDSNLLQSRRAPCYEEFKAMKGVRGNSIHPDQD